MQITCYSKSMSETPSSQPETKIVEIDHGGEKLFEYTYVNGAQHVYAENPETGKKDHLSHETVLESQGYGSEPDVNGNYLLPSHPSHPGNKTHAAENYIDTHLPQADTTPLGASTKHDSKDDGFFGSLKSFSEETRQLAPAPGTKGSGHYNRARLEVLTGNNSQKQATPVEQKTEDSFSRNFKKFESIDEDKPRTERYQPKHAAEKRYKAHMRKLGKPLLRLWNKGNAWIDEKFQIEDKLEMPVKPRNKVERQLHMFDKDLPESKLAKKLRMFDADLEYRKLDVKENRLVHKPTDASKYLLQIFPPEELAGNKTKPRKKAA